MSPQTAAEQKVLLAAERLVLCWMRPPPVGQDLSREDEIMAQARLVRAVVELQEVRDG